MDDDPNSSVKTELEATVPVLEQDIRGLDDYEHISISKGFKDKCSQQKAKLTQRLNLTNAVLAGLETTKQAIVALKNDGYPDIPKMPLPPDIMAEYQVQKADLDAAEALFVADEATNVSVNLGAPTGKPPAP